MNNRSNVTEQTIINLKTKVEEEKKIEEVLRDQLKQRKDACNNLESEIVGL